ncbi:tail fiber domain-containing protein [Salmonella enterica]|nr:tail fiber domain-containing protein [Salmonella enterica]EJT3914056.1 tail fiber domain-containing protein [Salmonella enterica]ELL1509998.1 tail fiber domain-containing protein [Salmonella enterica]
MAIIDDKTTRLGLPKPNVQNFLQDDVERLRESLDDVDGVIATLNADKKLEASQVPDNLAKLDAKGILLPAQIPVKVVQKDDNGKIPLALIPQAAINSKYDASNESTMLGLQAIVGDICRRTDLNTYFMLLDTPASNIANWRRWHEDAFYDKFATKANPLESITGPLPLKAEGVGDYDAATMKQLRAVANTGDAATMSGVMNNFIGAVEWFNGSRETLPPGYVAADGQTLNRADWPDLWAAVASSMLKSVTEVQWNTKSTNARGSFYYFRGSYSQGNGSLTSGSTFRVPDLNGGQAGDGSIANTFLNGSAPSLAGNVGQLRESAAPNITGIFFTGTSNKDASASSGAIYLSKQDGGETNLTVTGTDKSDKMAFDASRSDRVYTGSAGELRPNTAVGIWIIRANGSFQAANTSWKVIAQDAVKPAVTVQGKGGELQTEYWISGQCDTRGFIRADHIIGGSRYLRIGILSDASSDPNAGPYNSIDLMGDGSLLLRNYVSAPGLYGTNIFAGLPERKPATGQGFYAEGPLQGGQEGKAFSYLVHHKKPDGTPLFDISYSFGVMQQPGEGSFETMASTLTCTNGIETRFTRQWRFQNNGYLYAPLAGNGGTSSPLLFDEKDPKRVLTTSKLWTLANPSDQALKRNIQDYDTRKSLAKIQAMRFRSFIFNDDPLGRTRRGLIAQEVQKIDESYVHDMAGTLTLDTSLLLADALAAIKVLAERVERLEGRT